MWFLKLKSHDIIILGASWRSTGITPVTIKQRGFLSGCLLLHLPGPYCSDLSPHLNLSTPICLQLKNQCSPLLQILFPSCFSSFNLQGHLNHHKSKHSNQTSPLFKMSHHRWGANPSSWLIGQFKRKMVNRGNYVSSKRPFHWKHGWKGSFCFSYWKRSCFDLCFEKAFSWKKFLPFMNEVWKIKVLITHYECFVY